MLRAILNLELLSKTNSKQIQKTIKNGVSGIF